MNDITVFINSRIGVMRDDVQLEINRIEIWLNEILTQTKNISKKERCEVCNSREMQYNLEQHHIAGRKHDWRVITVCRKCHAELSESQKTWDVRWLEINQTEYMRSAFFLLGLHDVLVLRSRFTVSYTCHAIATSFRQKISDLLQIKQEIYA